MISVETHLAAVAKLLAPVASRVREATPEVIAVTDPSLVGRVCAESVLARFPLPPFDNSQMDGYAVRASDIADATSDTPVRLPIGVATPAGSAPLQHVPGTASPVMTGAPVPIGADAIVPIEATIPPRFPQLSRPGEPLHEATVTFTANVAPGTFVRSKGEDQQAGETVIPAGWRITPSRIGALVAAGATEVAVRRRTQILVITTGDELAPDAAATETAELAPGLIHDANGPMLAAMLRAAGAKVRTARSGDSVDALLDVVRTAAPDVDLIVTSGGISAGAFEVVREAFTPLGAEFMNIAMQPGGPQGLGKLLLAAGDGSARATPPADIDAASSAKATAEIRVPVLCFPGNPVSSLLSAELFLLPMLRELAGLPAERDGEWRPLAVDTNSPEHKLQLRRSSIDTDGRVTPMPPGSHLLHDFASASLVAEIPLGVSFAPAGTPVFTWRINGE